MCRTRRLDIDPSRSWPRGLGATLLLLLQTEDGPSVPRPAKERMDYPYIICKNRGEAVIFDGAFVCLLPRKREYRNMIHR
jgi:hypothetical protein